MTFRHTTVVRHTYIRRQDWESSFRRAGVGWNQRFFCRGGYRSDYNGK